MITSSPACIGADHVRQPSGGDATELPHDPELTRTAGGDPTRFPSSFKSRGKTPRGQPEIESGIRKGDEVLGIEDLSGRRHERNTRYERLALVFETIKIANGRKHLSRKAFSSASRDLESGREDAVMSPDSTRAAPKRS